MNTRLLIPLLLAGAVALACGTRSHSDAAVSPTSKSTRQAMKPGGAPMLKSALRRMGRDCGDPRPPLTPPGTVAAQALGDALGRIAALGVEPRGW